MFYPFFIPLISFFLQVYPRFFNKYFGVDVWTRLLEIDHIRKNHHQIPRHKLSGQFIVDGYFDYPPAFPWLLSFISKEKLLEIQGFVAPFFDALQALLVFYIAHYLTGSWMVAFTAQLIYILTPMIAIENSYLTPRSFGYLNFSLAVIPLLLFLNKGNIEFYIIGLLFSTLIFLTHRFATQSFLFISIFFSFFLKTTVFIQAFSLGFIMAVIVTRGYYLRVLKGHLYNIYFWIRNLDYRFSHQIRGVLKKDTKKDWVERVNRFLSVFSPIAVFGLNPWALSAFIISIGLYLNLLPTTPLFIAFAAWVIFFYVLGVAVLKIKYLMPVGEGQRYMEMATVPSSILSSYILFELLKTPYKTITSILFITLLFINLSLILFIQIKGVLKDKNRSVTDDLANVFDFINKMKIAPRIICIPHQNTTMTIYFTKAQVFVNADNPGLMKIQEVYPILRKSLSELTKKYKLTHVLIKESFISLEELKLSKRNIEYVSGDVKLIALK